MSLEACNTRNMVIAFLHAQSLLREQEFPSMAIIKAQYSEVWLDRFRETHGDGQGSGLSGQTESRDAGLDTAPLATAE